MEVDVPQGPQFYMCECRLRTNFFVRSADEHFEYDGDEGAFARQYERFVRHANATGKQPPPPPIEDVLADIVAQREERRRAPLEAQLRAERIAAEYKCMHLEVYTLDSDRFLHPDFKAMVEQFRKCPDRPRAIEQCTNDLISRGILTRAKDDVFTFPVFTETFCDLLEAELGSFEASGLPKTRPNTMNRYGVILRELGMCHGLLDPLVFDYVNPLATRLFSVYTETLDSYRAFTVKYKAESGGDAKLSMHADNAEVTLNVNIGGEWTGGQVTFFGTAGRPPQTPVSISLRRGFGLLHAGREMHQAEPVQSGRRENLILWCRSSGVRNVECPMCSEPPRVVPTNVFGHDGFTVPPSALGGCDALAH